MRGSAVGVVSCAAACAASWTGVARADMAPAPPPVTSAAAPAVAPAPPAPAASDELSHAGQVGITARLGTGVRFLSTYQQTTTCNDTGDRACFARVPTVLELEVAYGLDRRIDVLGEIGIGLEQDFSSVSSIAGPHEVRLSPGLRFYFGQSKHTKLFATVQVVFDFSDYKSDTGGSLGNDFGFRNVNAFLYDINKSVGVYVFGGETFEFARWFDVELEAGVGVQLRYP
jgi:hypothetical protein